MMKVLNKALLALLIAALMLTPVALMEEEIAPEPVDAPVEVSDSVELPDEIGGEMLELQADYVAEGDASGIPADEAHFPDAGFRQYVINTFGCDKDGNLSNETCKNVKSLLLQNKGLTSLQGIEYFPNLEMLECSDNALTTLDVSHNPTLRILDCRNNKLTALDVSACPLLMEIVDDAYSVYDGYQTQDMTRRLFFDIKVALTAGTNVAAPIPIDEAHFPDPAFRQAIVDSFARAGIATDGMLTYSMRKAVACIGDEGHIPGFTIKIVEISGVTGKPTWKAGITSLQGVEYFPNVIGIECSFNPIPALDVSMLKKLERLDCYHCGMTSLNISGCENLLSLYAYKNALKSVELPKTGHFAGFPTGYKRNNNSDKTVSYSKSIEPKQFNIGMLYGFWIEVDKNVKVTGSNGSMGGSGGSSTPAAPAVPASFANSSEGVTVTVDASSTAKNTVATVVAPAESTTQIEVTGATGKKFKSSNKKVATVNKNGVVTFKGSGRVKITYKVGKKTRKVTLTVTDPTFPTGIALNLTGTVEAKVGEPVTLTATLNEGAVSGVKWKSSNKKIAAVNANGNVTFKKAGSVKITATSTRGNKKASVTFKVTK